jgi:hypothetical protein
MYKDPNYPSREIVEVYDPPFRVRHTQGRDAKAIVYYKFKGTGNLLYYHLDVYEENGGPYEYLGGNWYANSCERIEEPKNNKAAVKFLEKE